MFGTVAKEDGSGGPSGKTEDLAALLVRLQITALFLLLVGLIFLNLPEQPAEEGVVDLNLSG